MIFSNENRFDTPPPYYPVFLNLAGRRCVVVGGGRVARGKAQGLCLAGARVTLIAPDVPEADAVNDALLANVEIVRREFMPEDLDCAWLVIAATDDPAVNHAVACAAEARRIWVNVVDTPAECSLIMPAVLARGPLRIAVSTSGASPSLAGRIRRKLEKQFGPEWETLTLLLWRLRQEWEPRAREAGLSYERCFQAWVRVLDLPLLDVLREYGEEEALRRAREALELELQNAAAGRSNNSENVDTA